MISLFLHFQELLFGFFDLILVLLPDVFDLSCLLLSSSDAHFLLDFPPRFEFSELLSGHLLFLLEPDSLFFQDLKLSLPGLPYLLILGHSLLLVLMSLLPLLRLHVRHSLLLPLFQLSPTPINFRLLEGEFRGRFLLELRLFLFLEHLILL